MNTYSNRIPLPHTDGHGFHTPGASCHLTHFPYRKIENERQQELNHNVAEHGMVNCSLLGEGLGDGSVSKVLTCKDGGSGLIVRTQNVWACTSGEGMENY